jgi:hypothetical protein
MGRSTAGEGRSLAAGRPDGGDCLTTGGRATAGAWLAALVATRIGSTDDGRRSPCGPVGSLSGAARSGVSDGARVAERADSYASASGALVRAIAGDSLGVLVRAIAGDSLARRAG